jgi:ubiquinone/menaquinone biosynthesis C-methylase UbiE
MIKKLIKFLSLLNKKPAEEKNIDAYSSSDIISYYSRQEAHLQPAERTVLELLRTTLPQSTMLDIGVGAGRTTSFFAPLVKQYTGIDYAAGMVEVCKKLYPGYRFEEGDVRQLKFNSTTFDFVLFSFNGLDSISSSDRSIALKEINRVLKPGGCFVFSAHNLKATGYLFRYTGFNPKSWYKTFVLRSVNKGYRTFPDKNEMVVFDGTLGYQVSNYYINPNHQLKQLADAGFINVSMIGQSGKQLAEAQVLVSSDKWIYFICYKSE